MTIDWNELGWVDRRGRLNRVAVPADGQLVTLNATQAGWAGVEADLVLRPDTEAVYMLPDGSGALVLCDLVTPEGDESPWCSRSVLRRALSWAEQDGAELIAAAELEFFLVRADQDRPVFDKIEQYGIVAGEPYEPVLKAIRRLRSSGVPVIASNCEYGAGQFEINLQHGPALAAADAVLLLRRWAREAAASYGLGISFDAKPWADNSGSGMHFHQSRWKDGQNCFWSGEAEQMSVEGDAYLAGLLSGMAELTVLGSPTTRAYLRRDDHSFCPTKVCWGGDNRTVALRVTAEREAVTRIEQRDAASDTNPYLSLAGQIWAGTDGIHRVAVPPPITTGDAYVRDDLPPLPASLDQALTLFRTSHLAAELLGAEAQSAMVAALEAELDLPTGTERTVF